MARIWIQNVAFSFTVGNTNELFKQGENPQKKVFFSKWKLETTKQKTNFESKVVILILR